MLGFNPVPARYLTRHSMIGRMLGFYILGKFCSSRLLHCKQVTAVCNHVMIDGMHMRLFTACRPDASGASDIYCDLIPQEYENSSLKLAA